MNLLESQGIVENRLVVEHNYTHTGLPKPFHLEELLSVARDEFKLDDFKYFKVDLANSIRKNARTSEELHFNERLMRSSFTKLINVTQSDIVFAVDADEIIYREAYSKIIDFYRKKSFSFRTFRLPMYQFYYKMNYLWSNFEFKSAVAGKKIQLGRRHVQWRDKGREFNEMAGCHFSWQLTIPEMIEKLQNYSHSFDYRHLANNQILEGAVRNKTYPFDPEREFRIKELKRDELLKIVPVSFLELENKLEYLLGDGYR
jgi:hypothetical protein